MRARPDRCECRVNSIDHRKGRCPKRPTLLVRRGGREFWVCVDCTFTGDVKLRDLNDHDRGQ